MIPPRLKLAAFLVPGLIAGIYLWWYLSDKQAVLRRIDALLETASVQRLTLGNDEVPFESFRSIIDDPFELDIPSSGPSGSFPEEEAVGRLRDFRNALRSSKIRRLETSVELPGPDEARVEALIEADLAWLGGSRSLDRFEAEMLFQRRAEGWILTRAVFLPRPGK